MDETVVILPVGHREGKPGMQERCGSSPPPPRQGMDPHPTLLTRPPTPLRSAPGACLHQSDGGLFRTFWALPSPCRRIRTPLPSLPKAFRWHRLPAFGGIGTARALAKFYQILARDGELDGVPLLPGRVVRTARQLQVSGPDRTLLLPTAFTGGFKADPLDSHGRKHRALFGPSLTAFGQPGAGGSHAFADPENGISFAYVMNQMGKRQ